MKLTIKESKIRTIRQDDSRFMLNDGIVICPRAGFEINEKCPTAYKQMLMTALDLGWIRPVAHVYGKELTMDAMR